ncbi:MAG: sulfoxide reductase heme-binding subunit YedZ [Gammaproteobacteria bacterium]|nr:sulfoxide reductase heme-binding subunit YedZ [Gammaproteobacteria bacterium]
MNFPWSRLLKPVVFLICLIPFAYLLTGVFTENLGANPVEYLARSTGDWSLRFLLIVLAVTPLRRITGWRFLIKLRRMLGLFAFFYVTVHLLVYAVLDLTLDWSFLLEDILERPYITIGFTAWVLLIPLAVTSTNRMMRWLGKRWKTLHKLVYLIGLLGVIHYWWLIKKDLQEPIIYATILFVLLAMRVNKKYFNSLSVLASKLP